MTAVLALRKGSGRHSADAEAAFELGVELAIHNAEALTLVADCTPHVSALRRAAIELGPVALRHALALGRLLERYADRHAPEPEPLERAA